jgi:hypothetical protein
MKIVFIAGPYFGDGRPETIQANIDHAERYQIALANLGIGFFCPHNHTHRFEIKARQNEGFYRTLDKTFLERCTDAVVAIPGWETSAGSRNEIEYAKQNGIPIFYPKSPGELGEVISWAKGS